MDRLPERFPLAARLALAALAAYALRAAYIWHTPGLPPHPDLESFALPAREMVSLFDTSPREPLFVWWLRLTSLLGADSLRAVRLCAALWTLPALPMLYFLARRFVGNGGAWAAVALYALLPGQVQSDGVGLRHAIETVGVLGLLLALTDERPLRAGALAAAAGAVAALTLTRISYFSSAVLILGAVGFRLRNARPLLALLPAALLLLPHFADNRRKTGDPLYSVNMHAYFFANLEFIGLPGFPATLEEWQKDTHARSLTYRQWAFEKHTPAQYAGETIAGFFRCLWIFFERVYFAAKTPAAAKWALLALYALGAALALAGPPGRFLFLCYGLWLLPYAFVSHIFWAGRFFAPFTPVVLIFTTMGARAAAGWAARAVRAVQR